MASVTATRPVTIGERETHFAALRCYSLLPSLSSSKFLAFCLDVQNMARGNSSFKRGGRGGSRFGYRGNTSFRGGRGRGRGRGGAPSDAQPLRDEDGNQLAERFEQVKTSDEVDEKLGFARVQEGGTREGWLINMHPVRFLRALMTLLAQLPCRP